MFNGMGGGGIEGSMRMENVRVLQPEAVELQKAMKELNCVDSEGKPVYIEKYMRAAAEEIAEAEALEIEIEEKVTDPHLKAALKKMLQYIKNPTIIYSQSNDIKYTLGKFSSDLDAIVRKSEPGDENEKYKAPAALYSSNRLRKNNITQIFSSYDAYFDGHHEYVVSDQTKELAAGLEKEISAPHVPFDENMNIDDLKTLYATDLEDVPYDGKDVDGKIAITKLTVEFIKDLARDVLSQEKAG